MDIGPSAGPPHRHSSAHTSTVRLKHVFPCREGRYSPSDCLEETEEFVILGAGRGVV